MTSAVALSKIDAEIARRIAQRDVEGSRERCRSLVQFVREAWHVLEPTNLYVHGWHIDFICAHLEAITYGRFLEHGLLNRLLGNVPPGTMKSLLVSVFWPAFEWGPCNMPDLRYLSTSYSEDYVKRDSRRMRDLVASEWYQARWGDHVKLTRWGETSFANDRTGWREGVPFGSLTGGRGDRLVIDDPHSTETAESASDRARTTRIFRESVPLRLNDPSKSAIVVIMQRLHQEDVSGVALSLKLGYTHVCLPMEFEADRRCSTIIGADPRIEDGELLFPERFTRAVVERDKIPLGSFGVAGQFQQRPVAREGGLFKRSWFKDENFINAAPDGTRWVRRWDLAATASRSAAYTAGVKMGVTREKRFVVAHVVRGQWEWAEVRRQISAIAASDGKSVPVVFPKDPGSAGKAVANDLVVMLAGYSAYSEPETGDKVTRAQPFSAQCEAGNVDIVKGEWNQAYLDELCLFPGATLKDQVDASSGAFSWLTGRSQTAQSFVGPKVFSGS